MKISKSLYIWSLLGSLITFFAWHMGLANIDILKGTYSILKDDYKHLSIIHGAVATEKDYLMKLYDYGSLGKAVKIDVTGVDYDVPDVKNSSAIVQLVHLFFHRANPLSTGRGDFALTKSLGVLDLEGKKSFVTVMAWLLGSADFKIAHEDAGDIKIEKTIQKIWTPVSKASGNTITFSKIVGFVNQAVTQSRGFNAVFDVPSIYMVLLSMVYKIAATDKSLIKLFYEKLDEQTKKIKKDSIFVDGKISDDWVNEKFSPANAVEFEQSIKAFDFKDVANIVNSYEKIVYLSLLPGDYPTVAPYGEAYFYYDPKDKKKFVNIPDCMENVLRNMLNVIFYNKGKGEFDISDAVKKLKISPKLKPLIFYKKYKNVLDVDLQEVHNSWMYVVSNIPFVAYYHCVGRKERGSKFGYIKIPSDVLDKEFFGKHYIEVSQEDIVYEVGPSLRNMIIIFNNLLGLGLFEKEAGNTENQKIGNAFKRDDFVKYYFPELCKKLKID
ncbi:MAG: hypothetical protein US22_C0002G0002 [candidate division TM6 bacterium GW2011_GWF2_36_6]|nr:MAG: hypothetical protein US22_C0002G0002 [candidate division TM6 bacterium GW2011_GWF2_36_6]